MPSYATDCICRFLLALGASRTQPKVAVVDHKALNEIGRWRRWSPRYIDGLVLSQETEKYRCVEFLDCVRFSGVNKIRNM